MWLPRVVYVSKCCSSIPDHTRDIFQAIVINNDHVTKSAELKTRNISFALYQAHILQKPDWSCRLSSCSKKDFIMYILNPQNTRSPPSPCHMQSLQSQRQVRYICALLLPMIFTSHFLEHVFNAFVALHSCWMLCLMSKSFRVSW